MNSIYKQRKDSDAPIAFGRSGVRLEKGLSASGLIGERFMVSNDPRLDSKSQRSWLPYDDPALKYKENGVPVAQVNIEIMTSMLMCYL